MDALTPSSLQALLVVALVVEAVWQTLRMIWEKPIVGEIASAAFTVNKIGPLVVGILVAFAARLDLLALAGVELFIPYLGSVLTGILLSRGSNFLHDIWAAMSSLKTYIVTRTTEKVAASVVTLQPDGKVIPPVVPPTSVAAPTITVNGSMAGIKATNVVAKPAPVIKKPTT